MGRLVGRGGGKSAWRGRRVVGGLGATGKGPVKGHIVGDKFITFKQKQMRFYTRDGLV